MSPNHIFKIYDNWRHSLSTILMIILSLGISLIFFILSTTQSFNKFNSSLIIVVATKATIDNCQVLSYFEKRLFSIFFFLFGNNISSTDQMGRISRCMGDVR